MLRGASDTSIAISLLVVHAVNKLIGISAIYILVLISVQFTMVAV